MRPHRTERPRADDDLRADVALLRAEVAALRAELRRTTGPRDGADRALLAAIADAVAGLPFRAGDVLQRAEDVPTLAAALLAADIIGAKSLGKLLARCQGSGLERVNVRGRPHWLFVSLM